MQTRSCSIYTDLYLDGNNCGRGKLECKDWEAVQTPYAPLCGSASAPVSCCRSATPRPQQGSQQTP